MRYVPTLETNAYDSTSSYQVGTTITYNGIVYQSIQDVPANTSITDTNYWIPLSNAANVPYLNSRTIDTATEIAAIVTPGTDISISKILFHDFGNIRIFGITFESSVQIASGTNKTIATLAPNYRPITKGFGCDQTTIGQINSGNGNIAIRKVGASIAANTDVTLTFILMMP